MRKQWRTVSWSLRKCDLLVNFPNLHKTYERNGAVDFNNEKNLGPENLER
jgi:hypothetical protein